jgi:hypothetical protein
MEKKTILLEIELPEGRNVVAHFQMQILDGDIIVARSNPHTVNFMPEDQDFDALFAEINANITTRRDEGFPWPPIPADEWARAVAVCSAVHTPEVKAAYEQWKADNFVTIVNGNQ